MLQIDVLGRGSSVGITTHYGLGDAGFESRRVEIFRTSPDRPWGPPNLLYDRYQVSFLRVKRPERGVELPFPSSAKVKERVEL